MATFYSVGSEWIHKLEVLQRVLDAKYTDQHEVLLWEVSAASMWFARVSNWDTVAACNKALELARTEPGHGLSVHRPLARENIPFVDDLSRKQIHSALATIVVPALAGVLGLHNAVDLGVRGPLVENILGAIQQLSCLNIPEVQASIVQHVLPALICDGFQAVLARLAKSTSSKTGTLASIAVNICDSAAGLKACMSSGFVAKLIDTALVMEAPILSTHSRSSPSHTSPVLAVRVEHPSSDSTVMQHISELIRRCATRSSDFASFVWTAERAALIQRKWLATATPGLLCNGSLSPVKLIADVSAAMSQLGIQHKIDSSDGSRLSRVGAVALLEARKLFGDSLAVSSSILSLSSSLAGWAQLTSQFEIAKAETDKAISLLQTELKTSLDALRNWHVSVTREYHPTTVISKLRETLASTCSSVKAEWGSLVEDRLRELSTTAERLINTSAASAMTDFGAFGTAMMAAASESVNTLSSTITQVTRVGAGAITQVTDGLVSSVSEACKSITDIIQAPLDFVQRTSGVLEDMMKNLPLQELPELAARALTGIDEFGRVAAVIFNSQDLALCVKKLIEGVGKVDSRIQNTCSLLVGRMGETLSSLKKLVCEGPFKAVLDSLGSLKNLTPTVSHMLTSLGTLGTSLGELSVVGPLFSTLLKGRFSAVGLVKSCFENLVNGSFQDVFDIAMKKALSSLIKLIPGANFVDSVLSMTGRDMVHSLLS